MPISIQRTRLLGTVLSVINIAITVFFIPLWLEYAEAVFGNKISRLSGNNVALDGVMIAFTIIALFLSIWHLVKIGKGQVVSLRIPLGTFVLYCVVILALVL